ncbi:hypothetical protein OS42_45100 [Dickeya oryzae]
MRCQHWREYLIEQFAVVLHWRGMWRKHHRHIEVLMAKIDPVFGGGGQSNMNIRP